MGCCLSQYPSEYDKPKQQKDDWWKNIIKQADEGFDEIVRGMRQQDERLKKIYEESGFVSEYGTFDYKENHCQRCAKTIRYARHFCDSCSILCSKCGKNARVLEKYIVRRKLVCPECNHSHRQTCEEEIYVDQRYDVSTTKITETHTWSTKYFNNSTTPSFVHDSKVNYSGGSYIPATRKIRVKCSCEEPMERVVITCKHTAFGE